MTKTSQGIRNSFFYNTLIVISSGFIIKLLGLLNKIVITRLLGTAGMSLYIMSFPTILLFINISSFSLNITISKLVAESLQHHFLSPKRLIKEAIKLSIFMSIITILVLFLIIKPLTTNWLNNPDLFFPILSTIILIPLVGISDTLKGYFNGLKKMTIPATAGFIEQLTRIIFSILFIVIFKDYNIVFVTTLVLVTLSIGELCSIIYLTIKLKKYKPLNIINTTGEKRSILKVAVPNTFTRLIGSITYFFEPIIYTSVLLFIGFKKESIQTEYTIINAYAIPLLTTASFLSIGIATTLIPHIAENYVLKKMDSIAYYVHKTLVFAIVPGLLIAILLFLYPAEFMNLIYNTSKGVSYIRPFVFLFSLYYIQAPIVAILQAIGKSKLIFWCSTIINLFRLVLIAGLSFIPKIGITSIFYAITATAIISTIIVFLFLVKYLKYKPDFSNILNIILLLLITFGIGILIKRIIPINFIFNSLIIAVLFASLTIYLKLLDIKSLHINSKH